MQAHAVPLAPGLGARGGRGRALDLLSSRLVPALIMSVLVVDKLQLVRQSFSTLTTRNLGSEIMNAADQTLGLGYFALLTFLYVVRLPRLSGARDWLVVPVTLVGSFGMLVAARLPGASAPRPDLVAGAGVLLLAGLAFSVFTLAFLGRSFSLLPEARRLVTGGPYRLSRHPLYLGEVAAGLGFLIPTVGGPGAGLVVLSLAALSLRIRWEERVLAREFPDRYPAYRRRVPMIVPLPWLRPSR
ncbi:MAG: methyltransferase family protein [Candidatus Dormibacteraceae bacterium]